MGAHVATLPPAVLRQLFHHPLTDKGLAAFLADWAKTRPVDFVSGDPVMAKRSGTTMADQAAGAQQDRHHQRDRRAGRRLSAAQPRFPGAPSRASGPAALARAGMTESGQGVVDLQQFMVERLRGEINKLRNDQDEILANTATISRPRSGSTRRWSNCWRPRASSSSSTSSPAISACCWKSMWSASASSSPTTRRSVRSMRASSSSAAARSIARSAARTSMSCCATKRSAIRRSSAPGAELVRSDAMLRLNISSHAPAGLIAFGARHPGYFHAGQGTELMSFLGRVIEFGIRTWLDLPKP